MYLSHSGMDTNSVIEIFFGDSFENCDCESLGDFSCIGAQEMETYNFVVVCFVDYYFGIAVLSTIVVDVPLERFENTTISDYVLGSEGLDCIFLAVAYAAILDGGEDCSRNIFIAHQTSTSAKQPVS